MMNLALLIDGEIEDELQVRGAAYSTYTDWDPRRVDLLSAADLERHTGIPIDEWEHNTWAPDFPNYRRDAAGVKRWRWPDIVEWMENLRG